MMGWIVETMLAVGVLFSGIGILVLSYAIRALIRAVEAGGDE